MKNSLKTWSKVSLIIIFLGLIGSISESLRLGYNNAEILFSDIYPHLMGAFFSSVCLLGALIFYFYQRYYFTIALCLFALALMIIIQL